MVGWRMNLQTEGMELRRQDNQIAKHKVRKMLMLHRNGDDGSVVEDRRARA